VKTLRKRVRCIALLSSLFPFLSGSFFLPPSFPALVGSHEVPDKIEAIYAPFDTLSTDVSDYIWPTNASTIITSSFGDYRRTHFHGGIDISTNNQRGYPVYASRSGHVSRIRISPYGYGKMLYVRHPDGYVTTYAHLQKFNNEIDTFVKTEQKRRRRISLDIEIHPSLFPVEKGEIIAYTGDTGVGSAHLHFEVRDTGMNPVNPFLFPVIASSVQDEVEPTFHAIALSPLDHHSIVQGKKRTVVISTSRVRAGEYSVQGVLRLTGAIGLSVRVTDRSNVKRYQTGAHRFEMYLDDKLIFSSVKNRIPERHSKQIALHYDAKLLRARKGRFEKLYIAEGNLLPFYNRLPEGAGVFRTSEHEEGKHTLRIVAWDVNGNRSTLTAHLILNHPPELELGRVGSRPVLILKDPSQVQQIAVWTQPFGTKGWNRTTLSPERLAIGEGGLILPFDLSKLNALKVVAENKFGTPSYPAFLVSPSGRGTPSGLDLELEEEHTFLHITLRAKAPIVGKPTVGIRTGEQIMELESVAVDIDEYVATFPWKEAEDGLFHVQASATIQGKSVTAHRSRRLFVVDPKRGRNIVSDDGEFSVTFPPHSLYAPLVCWIEKEENGYTVHPTETVLAKPVFVRFKSQNASSANKLGLFFSDGGGYGLLQSEVEEDAYDARIGRYLGSFALLRDEIPPTISHLRATARGGKVAIAFRLTDNLSGIDSERFTVLLNEEFLPVEYDPETKRVSYEGTHRLRKGRHTLRIAIADRMGNERRLSKTFTAQ
jgi:hypothetical protein